MMVNVAPADVPALVVTVTLAVPAEAIKVAGTLAVSVDVFVTVVVSAVRPHSTLAPGVKFAPLIVRVNASPPAVAEFGDRLESVGGIAAVTSNVAYAE